MYRFAAEGGGGAGERRDRGRRLVGRGERGCAKGEGKEFYKRDRERDREGEDEEGTQTGRRERVREQSGTSLARGGLIPKERGYMVTEGASTSEG